MSHGKIREDKNCLNCGHYVENHFCGHCGQENVEPRQPFHYLFTHFFEDFTHYDGQFWGTLKALFFKPGKLTNIFLEGKRQKFVPPVKLYIFVSFITFLIPSFLPNTNSKNPDITVNEQVTQADSILKSNKSLEIKLDTIDISNSLEYSDIKIGEAKTKQQFDSLYSSQKLYYLSKPLVHKLFDLKEKGYTYNELSKKFKSTFTKAIPKALFIFLPIFAFLLWLMHNKKKWWYFDHGVFTLHYFCFLLLASLFYICESALVHAINWSFLNSLNYLIAFALLAYSIAYFFLAHKEVYKSSKSNTIIKGISLFFINHILIVMIILALVYYSFLSID